MHLDEEQVQRLLDGELEPQAEATVREHLAGCAECRERVARSQLEDQEVQALLRHLDHPLPRLDAQRIAWKARARDTRWVQLAAGIALALGFGAASYAIPGSPVPAWVEAAVKWVGVRSGRSHSKPVPSRAPEPLPAWAPDSTVAGIAVAPGRDLAISFTSTRGQARVSLGDGAEVVVRAPAGAAVFASHVDRLVIDNAASTTTFDIEIPRAAPRIEILVNNERVFLKEGSRITTREPVESGGSYLLPLTSSRP